MGVQESDFDKRLDSSTTLRSGSIQMHFKGRGTVLASRSSSAARGSASSSCRSKDNIIRSTRDCSARGIQGGIWSDVHSARFEFPFREAKALLITQHQIGIVREKLSGYLFPFRVASTMMHPLCSAAIEGMCRLSRFKLNCQWLQCPSVDYRMRVQQKFYQTNCHQVP